MGAVGEVERVRVERNLYRVRVYADDDAGEIVNVYFDTEEDAKHYVARLPEATR